MTVELVTFIIYKIIQESSWMVLSRRANKGDFENLSCPLLIVEQEVNSEMSLSESSDLSEKMHFFFESS